MTTFKEGIRWFWLLVIILLVWLTYRDFVVNSDMFLYGNLEYNFEWFIRYAIATYGEYISIASLLSVVYWFTSPIYKRRKITAFTVWITIFGMWVGGFLDLLWFFMEFIFRGKLIGLFDVWWWFPQYWLFGIEWTTLHQIMYTIVWAIFLAIMWYKVSRYSD